MTPRERQDAERIVAAARGRAGALIPTLLALQERLGHLPESALELVGGVDLHGDRQLRPGVAPDPPHDV